MKGKIACKFLGLMFCVGVAVLFFPHTIKAAEFKMTTGAYTGKGAAITIAGLPFTPDLVIIKGSTVGSGVFKTSAMPSTDMAYITTTANNTASQLVLTADGFTLGTNADVNSNGVLYYWIAVGGSDCSVSGKFCVGSYTGNASSPRAITTGFEPGMALVKSGANRAVVRYNAMPTNYGDYWLNTAPDTTGAFFTTLFSTGFNVGSSNNSNGVTYYYFAFAQNSSNLKTGTYAGDGLDNRNITGVGFSPEALFIKNVNGGTSNRIEVFKTNFMFGDLAIGLGSATAGLNNLIQSFSSDGFQIGSALRVNASGNTMYYMALNRTDVLTDYASGTFELTSSSYVGNGTSQTISSVGFNPDVVITGRSTNYVVYNTIDSGAGYAHFKGALSNSATTGGITLGTNSFLVGSDTRVNTNAATYNWQAFGNAFNFYENRGAEDFVVGSYIGTGITGTNIAELGFQPDMVFIKTPASTNTVWASRLNTVGQSNYLAAIATGTGEITALISDGFTVSASANVNSLNTIYHYYAFKEGHNFKQGTYTGNATDNRDISISADFQPDLVWVKSATAILGVFKPSNILDATSMYFTNSAYATTVLKSLLYSAFRVGTATNVNGSGTTYFWTAWNGKKFTQASYRFFANADSAAPGAALAAQNTMAVASNPGEQFRLRMIVDVANATLYTSGINLKLQYAKKGIGSCATPQSSYADVTAISEIGYYDNPTVSDAAAISSHASDPTSANTINYQEYVEANNFTNSISNITKGQSGMFDFSLVDNASIADEIYCFRIVYATDAGQLYTYSNYPEFQTAGASVGTSINFSLSGNSLGFGEISNVETKYATSDGLGSSTDTTDAVVLSASTNAPDGYSITVNGTSLVCASCSGYTFEHIGGVASAPIVGQEQFGIRLINNVGTGTVESPYNTANWALDLDNAPDLLAVGDGDEVESQFGLRLMSNAGSVTPAGIYEGNLQFVITASY